MTVSEKSVQTTGESSPDNNKEKEDSVGLKTFKSLATIPTYAGIKTFPSENDPSVICKYLNNNAKTYFTFFSFLLTSTLVSINSNSSLFKSTRLDKKTQENYR